MNASLKKKTLSILILAGILSLLPMLTSQGYILTLMFNLFLYMTLSQSWNILGGYAGQVNVGFAVLFGTGAMITRFLWIGGIPFLAAYLIGGIFTLILGLFIGAITFLLKGPYFSIATLAMAMIARITIGNVFPRASSLPPSLLKTFTLVHCYYLSLITALAAFVVIYWVTRSRIGFGMKALREDEEGASALGVSPFRMKMTAACISSFFGGLAGGMYSYFYGSFYWHSPFDLIWCFEPILITFIGGAGTILGPVVGSLFFVCIEELFVLTAGEIGVVIFGIAFILIVLFLPQGVVGAVQERFGDPLKRGLGIGGFFRKNLHLGKGGQHG